jgi:hypothetical protein
MTLPAKNPPAGGADGPLELSSLGGVDLQADILNEAPSQEDNRASEITCASMRLDEVRRGLVREITRTTAIGAQAQAALYDGDDEVALACLRLHWRVMRVGIGPLAAELRALTGGRP